MGNQIGADFIIHLMFFGEKFYETIFHVHVHTFFLVSGNFQLTNNSSKKCFIKYYMK